MYFYHPACDNKSRRPLGEMTSLHIRDPETQKVIQLLEQHCLYDSVMWNTSINDGDEGPVQIECRCAWIIALAGRTYYRLVRNTNQYLLYHNQLKKVFPVRCTELLLKHARFLTRMDEVQVYPI